MPFSRHSKFRVAGSGRRHGRVAAGFVSVLLTTVLLAHVAVAFQERDDKILFMSGNDTASMEIIFKPHGESVDFDRIGPDDRSHLLLTGTYSSPDGQVEGLVIDRGTIVRPGVYPWDGILLALPGGRFEIANVSAVPTPRGTFDLKANKQHRKDFFSYAGKAGISAIQSHLLVTDGRVDVTERDNAKIFRRRLLMQDASGRIAVFDSSPDRISLYEAARIARERYGAQFAINLDMGTYDFCYMKSPGKPGTNCGLSPDTAKLTNILKFSYAAD